MVKLIDIEPPTLFDSRLKVISEKKEFTFENQDEAKQFVFDRDCRIVGLSLARVAAKVRCYSKITASNFHLDITKSASKLLLAAKQNNFYSNPSDLIEFLQTEVCASLTSLRKLCTPDGYQITDQCKCLVVLFCVKYAPVNA